MADRGEALGALVEVVEVEAGSSTVDEVVALVDFREEGDIEVASADAAGATRPID